MQAASWTGAGLLLDARLRGHDEGFEGSVTSRAANALGR
jgi:hypothetical protein